jgi:lipopolysaccharide transport system ATP-binding protein
MSSNELAIEVNNLNKTFRIYDRPRDRVKQLTGSVINSVLGKKPPQYYAEFQALRDINFSVKNGETLGVIGHNGSGKSTLLQIICGTLIPTHGTVKTQGRIAALLELGSGFNPEFTGRENVFMNGTILGLSNQEIEERFDSIASFADIGEFIERPVKTYSSGMMLRLAFAVQSQIDPDILVVDEALAVGDARFQSKCFNRLKQLKEQGTSILLVTHSTDQIVNHCDRALLLDAGEQLMLTEPKVASNYYLDLLFGREKRIPEPDTHIHPEPTPDSDLSIHKDVFSEHANYNPEEYRWGDNAACITDFSLESNGVDTGIIESGQAIKLRLAIRFDLHIEKPILGITIKNKEGTTIFGTNTLNYHNHTFAAQGKAGTHCIVSSIIQCHLNQGDYFISVGVASKDGAEIVPHDRRYDSIHFQVAPTHGVMGMVNLNTQINIESAQ